MQSTINAIATQTLTRIEEMRLVRAPADLDDGKARVEILSANDDGIDATVYSKDKSYGVFLTARACSCTCSDFEFRGGTCKHAAETALFVLGETHPRLTAPVTISTPNLKLGKMRSTHASCA